MIYYYKYKYASTYINVASSQHEIRLYISMLVEINDICSTHYKITECYFYKINKNLP